MRNLVFFEAVAAASEMRDAVERKSLEQEYLAAIVVLRLFTDWADFPGVLLHAPEQVVRIKEAIGAVPNSAVRYLFGTVVGAIRRSADDQEAVAAPLLSYAWLLEERDRHDLAADVLITVAESLEPAQGSGGDLHLAASVQRRLGDLALRRRALNDADGYYHRQSVLAKASGDTAALLDAQTRAVMVLDVRGNLGVAETALSTIIADAQRAKETRSEAYALRIRGSVIHRQNRPTEALRDFYAAYMLAPDWLEREWLLNDIAVCSAELGLTELARLAFTVLAKTAHSSMSRLLASVNLLHTAVVTDDRAGFDAVMRHLETQDVPREMHYFMRLSMAMAAARWTGAAAGLVAYQDVAADARRSGFHEIEFRAIEAIEKLKKETEPQVPEPAIPPDAMAPSVGDSGELMEITQSLASSCRAALQAAGMTERLTDW